MSSLCREQITKGLYLKIGSKHRIPKDLLLIIYRYAKDDYLERDYHTDAIYRNTIPNYSCNEFLPLGRGLEWAIKWKKDNSDGFSHTQICVFGEKNYLLKEATLMFQLFMIPAHTQLKIKYLNSDPMEEIMEDYSSYLESNRDLDNRLCIDPSGEAWRGPGQGWVNDPPGDLQ